ncbi:unnamed protein product [Leptidea sinapis]|uniref:Uncharacterized protein n=1 Tax=Leptidea sinapis TaxID=189913 RepID=A0A5E4Q977_9NEOP|nr:unnamed protein product [Leptidea sinapis]
MYEKRFFNYMRMSTNTFNLLLDAIKLKITRTEVMFSTATIGRWSRGIKLDAAANGGRWSLAAKCVGAIAMAI